MESKGGIQLGGKAERGRKDASKGIEIGERTRPLKCLSYHYQCVSVTFSTSFPTWMHMSGPTDLMSTWYEVWRGDTYLSFCVFVCDSDLVSINMLR